MSLANCSAPTLADSGVLALTGTTPTAETVLSRGLHSVTLAVTQNSYIVFGTPGSVPVPSATVGFFLPADVTLRFVTSNGANAFRVVRDTVDGFVRWTTD